MLQAANMDDPIKNNAKNRRELCIESLLQTPISAKRRSFQLLNHIRSNYIELYLLMIQKQEQRGV
jgi:hypothetical protein